MGSTVCGKSSSLLMTATFLHFSMLFIDFAPHFLYWLYYFRRFKKQKKRKLQLEVSNDTMDEYG